MQMYVLENTLSFVWSKLELVVKQKIENSFYLFVEKYVINNVFCISSTKYLIYFYKYLE